MPKQQSVSNHVYDRSGAVKFCFRSTKNGPVDQSGEDTPPSPLPPPSCPGSPIARFDLHVSKIKSFARTDIAPSPESHGPNCRLMLWYPINNIITTRSNRSSSDNFAEELRTNFRDNHETRTCCVPSCSQIAARCFRVHIILA